MSSFSSSHPALKDKEPWLEIVRTKVEAMRFGSVQIIVHEGRVTQVESTEKTRLGNSGRGDSSPSRETLRS